MGRDESSVEEEIVDLSDVEIPCRLTRVMCWENGQVLSYDQDGVLMKEFTGLKCDVLDKIYDAATPETSIEGDVVPLRWRDIHPRAR